MHSGGEDAAAFGFGTPGGLRLRFARAGRATPVTAALEQVLNDSHYAIAARHMQDSLLAATDGEQTVQLLESVAPGVS